MSNNYIGSNTEKKPWNYKTYTKSEAKMRVIKHKGGGVNNNPPYARIGLKEIIYQRSIKEYNDLTIGYNSSSLSWLAKILELRKGLVI